jgi:hypothetical protein
VPSITLYHDELQEYVAHAVSKACGEHLANVQAKLLNAQQLTQKMSGKRVPNNRHVEGAKVSLPHDGIPGLITKVAKLR